LKTTTGQHVSQQDISVQHFVATSVPMPQAVSGIQHVPVNNVVSNYPPAVLTSPAFSLSVSPYVCLPPSIHFPMPQTVGTESVSTQTPTCQVMLPEHRRGQDGSGLVQDSRVFDEELIQETREPSHQQQQPSRERADERWSSGSLDDASYRDKVLDDAISRERLEKRLMKEKIEHWKIRDGVDSDRVEFERLRTPHRNIIDAGMFLHSCTYNVFI